MGPRGVFAERFALLYAEAGDPPLKKVTESVARARRTDEQGRPVRVPAQRVSDWRRGRNVPARFTALSAVLEVLIGEARKRRPQPATPGLYELDAWRSLWEEALASPVGDAEENADEHGVCPYRGLAAFRFEDSNWFFGRERSTKALLERIEHNGIVMLVGASGAGKSSLMKAGVLPALRQDAIVLTPGTDPLKEFILQVPELAETFLKALDADTFTEFAADVRVAVGDRLVIVDQFEEAFTLGTDENRLQVFIQALHAAAATTAVLLGVRADFYARCLDYPELAEALQDRQMVLGPMTTAELREAVGSPAKAAGLQLEAGLADLMLRDLGVQNNRRTDAYDAGALPLLSHALLATWQRRQAGRLTIAGYRAAGGIQGAVAATAERAWADLDAAGQQAARSLLLRLVRVGDDTQDTRRRSTRRNLLEGAGNTAATETALEVLTPARLVTLDAGTVEITHEALLHAWPRLRGWIDEDRAGNLLRQRVEEDAATWEAQDRDSSLLYRGARLETAASATDLTASARDFLDASERQRRRAKWFRRAAVSLVLVFALIAVSAGVVVWQQRDDAAFSKVIAEANRLEDNDLSLAAQLALVAHQMRPDEPAWRGNLLSTALVPLATPLRGHTGAVYLTSFSPDGKTLATASYDNSARLWDVSDRAHPKPLGGPLTGHKSWVSSAVWNNDGTLLATAGDDHTVILWDVRDRANPKRIGDPLSGGNGTIYLIEFSPDGKTLATANEDKSVRLWDVSDPRQPRPTEPMRGHTGQVRSIAFSPDGRTIASTGDDMTLRMWRVADRALLSETRTGHLDGLHSVAYSPDGAMLATGGEDGAVRVWRVADPAHPEPLGLPLTNDTGGIWSVKFSPDGTVLAAAGSDSAVRLWNVTDPEHVSQLGKPLTALANGLFAVGFSPDGRSLATGSEDSVVRLWDLPSGQLLGHRGGITRPAFTPDGSMIATGSTDKTIRLWDVAATEPIGGPMTGHTGDVWSLAFRPDGKVLATGSADKTVRLWNVATRASIGSPITLKTRYSAPVAFNGDGTLLATGSDDMSVQLWNVTAPATPVRVGEPIKGHRGYINWVEFSGTTMVTASADQTVRLWDVADPVRPVLRHELTGHLGPVNRAVFSPDGKTLATGSGDHTIILWDTASGSRLRTLTGHNEGVASLSFSGDGARLVSGSGDSTVRIWDLATGVSTPISGPGAGDNSVLSPRADLVAGGGGDHVLRLWSLDDNAAAKRICDTTGGVLTEKTWGEHLPQLDYRPPCG
ncbi:hypothetical protein Lesp02_66060 [Lentzea sp. NBRC 105346]|uniref:NACHT and WD repeat domain-containing protein n=1 Tax=Lentzea sp. NBRC 105346 TaxID=3032205 RepID=UPI0024A3076A|nr:hypothetical protein [Lentzea sp. NBRC 105346]GLZ34419.1 hypothetical protein Lesp02_66060 [Lentzea sp. NBRC 105346]